MLLCYKVEKLKNLGIPIHIPHSGAKITDEMTIIYSSGILKDNPELVTAEALGCPLYHRSEYLSFLASQHTSIAIAGTHGKTTTSSMTAWALEAAGLAPSFALGGMVKEWNTNARWGGGVCCDKKAITATTKEAESSKSYFVYEADESDGTLINYHPDWAIVTNVDYDHLEFYGNKLAQRRVFRSFIDRLPSQHKVLCFDDPQLKKWHKNAVGYGFHPESAVQITSFEATSMQSLLSLRSAWDEKPITLSVPLHGRHHMLNACAVFTLLKLLEVPTSVIQDAISSFPGVDRRMSFQGEWNGIEFYDDYAHHPTEIAATFEGIQQAFPQKRVLTILQPHRLLRVQQHLKAYKEILKQRSPLWLLPTYSPKEENRQSHNPYLLFKSLPQAPYNKHLSSLEETRVLLQQQQNEFDVVVTLGAGDITRLFQLMHEGTVL